MKIPAIHTVTKTERIEVEIDPISVLDKIYWKTVPEGLAYISNGHWYKEDGYDGHRREELYSKDRKATDEEMHIYYAWMLMKDVAKR